MTGLSGLRAGVWAGASVFAAVTLVHLLVILALQAHAAIAQQETREHARHLGGDGYAAGTWRVSEFRVDGEPLTVTSDWAGRSGPPPPPGLVRHPQAGEVHVSDALADALELEASGAGVPLFRAHLPGAVTGRVGPELLVRPGDLVAVIGRQPGSPGQPPATTVPAEELLSAPFTTSTPPQAGVALIASVPLGAAVAYVASAAASTPMARGRQAPLGGIAALRSASLRLALRDGRPLIGPWLLGAAPAVAWAVAFLIEPVELIGAAVGTPVFPDDLTLGGWQLAAVFAFPPVLVAVSLLVGLQGGRARAGWRRGGVRRLGPAVAVSLLLAGGASADVHPDASAGLFLAGLLGAGTAAVGLLADAMRRLADGTRRLAAVPMAGRALTPAATVGARRARRGAPLAARAGVVAAGGLFAVGALLAWDVETHPRPPFPRADLEVSTDGTRGPDLGHALAALAGVRQVAAYSDLPLSTPLSDGWVTTCATAVEWLGVTADSCQPGQLHRTGGEEERRRFVLPGSDGPVEVRAVTVPGSVGDGRPLLTVDDATFAALSAPRTAVRTDGTHDAVARVASLLAADAPTATYHLSTDTPAEGAALRSARTAAMLASAAAAAVTLLSLVALSAASSRRDAPVIRALLLLGADPVETGRMQLVQTTLAASAVIGPPLLLGAALSSAVRVLQTHSSGPVLAATTAACGAALSLMAIHGRRNGVAAPTPSRAAPTAPGPAPSPTPAPRDPAEAAAGGDWPTV